MEIFNSMKNQIIIKNVQYIWNIYSKSNNKHILVNCKQGKSLKHDTNKDE